MSWDMYPDSLVKYLLEKGPIMNEHQPDMGQHENPPQKHIEYSNEEFPMKLTKACGHHCGIITTGITHKHEAHCSCVECHNTQPTSDNQVTGLIAQAQGGTGMDPGSIR